MKNILILLFLISCATKVDKMLETSAENAFKSGYIIKTTNEKIIESVKIADCVIKNTDYQNDILGVSSYSHYTGLNTKIVSDLLSDKKAIVSSYYKKYTKASAYRIPNTNEIYVNRAKLGSHAKTVASLIHEKYHTLGYGHKGNKKNKYNNINSVPYLASSMSKKYVEGCK
jgi:hypothetical protein